MLRALEEPLRQIVTNAGEEASVVVARVAEGTGNFGYNAQTGKYGDLVESGVLDPCGEAVGVPGVFGDESSAALQESGGGRGSAGGDAGEAIGGAGGGGGGAVAAIGDGAGVCSGASGSRLSLPDLTRQPIIFVRLL